MDELPYWMVDTPIWTKQNKCQADAVTELINNGMDLAQREPLKNGTVLHYWAGTRYDDYNSHQIKNSLAVVKLLVEKGADLQALDGWGFTPLLNAAVGRSDDPPNLEILDFLLEREEYSRANKIEAMELAGAVILNHEKNASLFHKAFDYWRKALHLRNMKEDDSGYTEKTSLNLKNAQITEWNTSTELEDVIEHPDKFMIQSFLVRLRIFSTKNWGAINYLLSTDLLDICWGELQNRLRFVELFNIVWITLETLLSRSDLRENTDAWWKIGRVVYRLTDVFKLIDKNSPDFWTGEIIKTSLDLIVSVTEFYGFVYLGYFSPLVRIISHHPQRLLNKDAMETLSKVRNYRGRNLLHEAIDVATSDANLYATIRLLLNAGCDPNAVDGNGNALLHIVAQLDQRYLKGDLNTIAVLLLDFGAQLNRKNKVCKTAVDLLIRKNEINCIMAQRNISWNLPDWCTELPSLTCLSARVIRSNRIPYLELPSTLIPMIEKHKIPQQWNQPFP